VRRGRTRSIEDGRSVFWGNTPFGIDRLYTNSNGKALHRIRRLSDGRTIMLHPDTKQILREFSAGCHYRKQSDERAALVPGDPAAYTTVQSILGLVYEKHKRFGEVADALNERNIRNGSDGAWKRGEIAQVARNPLYLGIGIVNRVVTGPFLDPSRPSARQVKPIQRRPPSEWQFVHHPFLRNAFVGEPFRTEIEHIVLALLRRHGPHSRADAAILGDGK
jgi:hypothetical protein